MITHNLNTILRSKSALVTGASRGVGRAIVEKLSVYNMKLGLIARSEESLRRVAEDVEARGSHALVLSADLRKRDEIEDAAKEFKRNFGTAEFLINVAGFGFRRYWEEGTLRNEKDMMAVNYIAPLILMRLFLPDMLKENKGHIININSISGLYASPYLGAYCASKAALLAYSTSLAYELKQTKVKMSSIFSGAIDTGFLDNYKGITKTKNMLTPEEVATKILSIIYKPRERLFIGTLKELVVVKVVNLYPQFFRKLIESRNDPPI